MWFVALVVAVAAYILALDAQEQARRARLEAIAALEAIATVNKARHQRKDRDHDACNNPECRQCR